MYSFIFRDTKYLLLVAGTADMFLLLVSLTVIVAVRRTWKIRPRTEVSKRKERRKSVTRDTTVTEEDTTVMERGVRVWDKDRKIRHATKTGRDRGGVKRGLKERDTTRMGRDTMMGRDTATSYFRR